jgi:hypothetical protein
MTQQHTTRPRIEAYSFGRITIDGQTYTKDVIILPAGVRPNWWRDEGHALKPADLTAVLQARPAVLVIGQGAHGYMQVTEEALASLKQAGIETVCAATSQAVEIYNQRHQAGDNVAAALHLTC